MRTHTITGSPIGDLTLVNTDGVLTRLWMGTHPGAESGEELGKRVSTGFEQATAEMAEYFAGERETFDVDTAASGNAFQHRVWTLLRRIPYGETRSYGALARDIGDPSLARDVGVANARNPIGIIVPCHRVIGSYGSLTGYAGGLERKRYLLDLEQRALRLF